MTKEQCKISRRNNNIAWKRLKACGAIPNNGKKYEYVLHHWDESLRHNNIDRYIQWNLYDIEVLTNQEHSRLHLYMRKKKHPLLFLRHLSEETRKKISEKVKASMTEEYRKKLSDKMKGRVLTEEWKKKISEAKKGSKNAMFGKHFSDVVRKKISEAVKLSRSHKHAQQIF